jgi:hypothetical protein
LLVAAGVGGWYTLSDSGDQAGDAGLSDSNDANNYGELPDWPPEQLPATTSLRSELTNRTFELELVNWWIERDSARVVVEARVTVLNAGGYSLGADIFTLLVDNVPIVASDFIWWQGRLALGQGNTAAVAVDFRDVMVDGELVLSLDVDQHHDLVLQG